MQVEASLPKPWRHPVFHEMRARIEELEEENRQLREQLVPPQLIFPRAWRLGPQVSQLLSALYAAQSYRSEEQLCAAIRRKDHEQIEPNHLGALMSHLRRLTRPHGIEICTQYTHGWALRAESRPIIAQALADVAEGRRV